MSICTAFSMQIGYYILNENYHLSTWGTEINVHKQIKLGLLSVMSFDIWNWNGFKKNMTVGQFFLNPAPGVLLEHAF